MVFYLCSVHGQHFLTRSFTADNPPPLPTLHTPFPVIIFPPRLFQLHCSRKWWFFLCHPFLPPLLLIVNRSFFRVPLFDQLCIPSLLSARRSRECLSVARDKNRPYFDVSAYLNFNVSLVSRIHPCFLELMQESRYAFTSEDQRNEVLLMEIVPNYVHRREKPGGAPVAIFVSSDGLIRDQECSKKARLWKELFFLVSDVESPVSGRFYFVKCPDLILCNTSQQCLEYARIL